MLDLRSFAMISTALMLASLFGCGDDGGAECTVDGDCASGMRCVAGACEPETTTDSGTMDAGDGGTDAGDGGADADAGPSDTGTGDTGPDPCPDGECIVALDGYAVGQPCALRANGELLCVETPPDMPPVFTSAGTFLGATHITRGARETCVLFEAHIVQCFRPGMAPFEVRDLFDALHIDTWADHTCVVRGPGGVSCWGDNSTGQIEPGGDASYPGMHDVPGVASAVQVATSRLSTCALLRDGTVSCWGDDFGTTPTAVAGVSDGVAITAGHFHYCVTDSMGGVTCFGGSPAGTEATAPDDIADAAEAIAFDSESCVRSAAGGVSCWGEANMPGQTEAQPLEPIVGLDDAVLIANHCALRETGVVSCWRGRDELVDATGL